MKIIVKLLVILILGLVAVFGWYGLTLSSRSVNEQAKVFKIESGSSTEIIAQQLEQAKIISSSLVFRLYFYVNKQAVIQAGEYIFDKNTSLKDVIAQLEKGETNDREVTILIREGLSIKDINNLLKNEGYLLDDSFLKLATTPVKNLPADLKTYAFMSFLPTNNNLEGYLFPDTYRMYKDFNASDLIKKMLINFEKKLNSELNTLLIQSRHTLPEIITMASILEKEVRSEEDMKIVAGIFWDRLKINQGLQSCATLGYILGVNKPQYSYEDTQIESAYNTYKYRGLPPGPISNPGLKAINAALNPTKTEYNYFLSRPDTGETVFSKTLDEHNAAKAKYFK